MATSYNITVATSDSGVITTPAASYSDATDLLNPIPFVYRLVLYVLGTPLICVNFLGNLLFISLVVKYRRMRSRSSTLAVSWAALDLFSGFVLIVQMVAVHVDWRVGENTSLCHFWVSLQIIPLIAGCSHMVVLVFDRYVAIKFPLLYPDIISYRRLKIYMISFWIYSILLSFVVFFWHDSQQPEIQCSIFVLQRYYNLFYIFLHVVPVFCICITLYVRIFVHVWRHERQIHVTHTITQDQFLQDRTISAVFVTVSIVYVITWLPFVLVSLVRMGTPGISQELQLSLLLTWLLGNSNGATKILVYYALHSDMTLSIKEAIYGEKALRRSSAAPSHSHA